MTATMDRRASATAAWNCSKEPMRSRSAPGPRSGASPRAISIALGMFTNPSTEPIWAIPETITSLQPESE